MTALHSDWAPSSMGRILSCPASVEFTKLYKRDDDSDASNLGTVAHGVLEDALTFGVPPEHEDIEIVEGVELAIEFAEQELLMGGKLHVEKRLRIPNTPVWGTADLVFERVSCLHIADYKHGYVPVEVTKNKQLLTYLRAAIHEYGPRDTYVISIIQPRYDHRDGPIRSYEVTQDDLNDFDAKLEWALANTGHFEAGAHCKYCPARGACRVFAAYIAPSVNTALYYDLTDRASISNDAIAALLDMSELLPGWISELRREAMRRVFADNKVEGWKVVPGKSDRDWTEDAISALPDLYEDFGIPKEALYESKFVSPATAEKQVKGAFKGHGRGKWKEPWERVNALIGRKTGAPALVRETDGRKRYHKGMEFGPLILDDDGGMLT